MSPTLSSTCEDDDGALRVVPRRAASVQNRSISAFPPPFFAEATPYRQLRFSPSTVDFCSRAIHTTMMMSSSRLAKMIVIGDCGVGKTALVNRFVTIRKKMFATIQMFLSGFKLRVGC